MVSAGMRELAVVRLAALQTRRPDIPVDLLACPRCRGRVDLDAADVRCTSCSATFPIADGVPVLDDDAAPPEAEADPGPVARLLHRLADDPRVYDAIQRAVGYARVAARLRAELADTKGVVLDVGAGTGAVEALLPPEATYVWFDYDVQKLRGYRGRNPGGLAVIGNARRLPFADGSVDVLVTVDVSHHLDDDGLRELLAEARRVTRGTMVFVDALRRDDLRSRLLWRYDAGAMPRDLSSLRDLVAESFVIDREQTFRVLHEYVLLRAHPRPR